MRKYDHAGDSSPIGKTSRLRLQAHAFSAQSATNGAAVPDLSSACQPPHLVPPCARQRAGPSESPLRLLAVTSIVLDAGGTEDDAIAALLHDAVEVQGGAPTLQRIRDLFGTSVADIVQGCKETDQSPKPPWRERKETYLQHLRGATPSVTLVALADKLDNARATLRDYRRIGDKVWRRFNAGREEQAWWYRSLVKVFEQTPANSDLVAELRSTVDTMFSMS